MTGERSVNERLLQFVEFVKFVDDSLNRLL